MDTVNIKALGPQNLRVLRHSARAGVEAFTILSMMRMEHGIALPTPEEIKSAGLFEMGCIYHLAHFCDERGDFLSTDWNPRVDELRGALKCARVMEQLSGEDSPVAHLLPPMEGEVAEGRDLAIAAMDEAQRILDEHFSTMQVEVPDTFPEDW